jgi:hypothetical protein
MMRPSVDDFARVHFQIDLIESAKPFVVIGVERDQLKGRVTRRRSPAHRALAYLGIADHHSCHSFGREVLDFASADLSAAPQHRHAVAKA